MVDEVINIKDIPLEQIIEGHMKQVLVRDDKRKVQINRIIVEPNAQGLEHVHTEDEYVYIIRGKMIDHTGEYTTGQLLINRKGSKHAVKAGSEGYEILIFHQGTSKSNPHLSAGYKGEK